MAFVASCSREPCPPSQAAPARNFDTAPAVFDQSSFTTLYAISDVHGGYDRMVQLLALHGIIDVAPVTPGVVTWTAGDATMVVVGDMIDKGSQSLEVLELLRALATDASSAGGHVIVTLGNHEAEFLVDPHNSKASAFDDELAAARVDSCEVGAGGDSLGAWLRTLPLAARVGRWFFAHAGNTHGRTVAELEQVLRLSIAEHDYDDPEIVGSDSLLESRGWWEATTGLAQANAAKLGVLHIVFGHTPDALGPAGEMAVGEDGVLIRIDTGMSPAVNYSQGAILRITHEGDNDVAVELRADGTTSELWRGPSH